jgi:sodium transport system ATP-binding protein
MLTITNLTKTYTQKDQKTKQKRIVGIDSLTFTVKPGRVLGLVGPNGAGKTTTMRIIAGLTTAHSGTVALDSKDITKISGYKKQVSLISAETQAYDRLTPREQLQLAYRLANQPEETIFKNINQLAARLDMMDFIDRPNQSFSSGMKQKISIARGLVTHPDIVVFDEVTNGLDIFAAKAVKEEIKVLKKQQKHIIFSTHILSDADELCDDIAIIHQGKMVLFGTKSELLIEYKAANLEELFFMIVPQSKLI